MLPEWGSPTESMRLFSGERSEIPVPWWFSTWHSLSLGISQLLVLFLINRELRCVCGRGHITSQLATHLLFASEAWGVLALRQSGPRWDTVPPRGGTRSLPWEFETPKWYSQIKLRVRNKKPTSSMGIKHQWELNITLLRIIILLFFTYDLSDKNEAENITFSKKHLSNKNSYYIH